VFEDSKSIFKSKTFWFNVLGTAATVLVNAANVLPPQYSVIALGIGNLILRFVTKTPVTLI
jgi:hypothetical protein